MLESSLLKTQELCLKYKVTIWEVNKNRSAEVNGTHLRMVYKTNDPKLKVVDDHILLSDIVLVIKRTWGDIREEVLKICKQLENRGIYIFGGCLWIEWSHSKITQYKTLADKLLFPKSIVFDTFDEDLAEHDDFDSRLDSIILRAGNELGFPLIVKTCKGNLGDGIYFLESEKALRKLLTFKEKENTESKDKFLEGIILQEFIKTHPDLSISNYYRINMIGRIPQSAVQFQLKWCDSLIYSEIKKLKSFAEAEEKPINLSFFNTEEIKHLVDALPYKEGVMGIDILVSEGKFFFLESNSGPSIPQIVKLGEKFKKEDGLLSDDRLAADQCVNFSDEIAQYCLRKIEEREVRFTQSNARIIKYGIGISIAAGLLFFGYKYCTSTESYIESKSMRH